jgi:hypothetical protein
MRSGVLVSGVRFFFSDNEFSKNVRSRFLSDLT